MFGRVNDEGDFGNGREAAEAHRVASLQGDHLPLADLSARRGIAVAVGVVVGVAVPVAVGVVVGVDVAVAVSVKVGAGVLAGGVPL